MVLAHNTKTCVKNMFERCKKNIKGIRFLYTPHDDVENHVLGFGLEDRYQSWSTVPGTRSLHWYRSTLEMKLVSFDDVSTSHGKPTRKKLLFNLKIANKQNMLPVFMMVNGF